ncbi:Transmembrane protein 64 [Hondaea fermentalgiana]|uniref:Transmembrane protein 64 n=1 Tax=Hondaea fermentalgiana TaxID=2315210 RepID=A0A2R5GRF7_9STRA|nr:Transmembrane protein 64 [Hondaea fermentalgiana]|eukprot:GBG33430.1 Transmembrane protein 64 [Hondaea fermentalgiana]
MSVKVALVGGVTAAAVAAAALWQSGMTVEEVIVLAKDQMDNLEDVLRELGPVKGPFLLFIIYVISTIFMLPLWGFHMTTGYVYGTFYAAMLIATTQALAAGAAFTMSRYVVGPYVRGFLERKYGRKFFAIDRAVSDEGLKITLLLRLSPLIPFGMNNYLCGITQMKLWEFVVGTWLGVLPGTTAYCNVGAMGKTALDKGTTPLQKGVMVLGLCAGLAVVKILSDLSSKALKDAGIGDEGAEDANKSAAVSSPESKKSK